MATEFPAAAARYPRCVAPAQLLSGLDRIPGTGVVMERGDGSRSAVGGPAGCFAHMRPGALIAALDPPAPESGPPTDRMTVDAEPPSCERHGQVRRRRAVLRNGRFLLSDRRGRRPGWAETGDHSAGAEWGSAPASFFAAALS
jgi:hypothetical protein